MIFKKILGLQLLIVALFLPLALHGQTTLEEIISDMVEPHEGRPHGVPSNFDWAINPRQGAQAPPEGWDAAIAWGQLYEWIEGNPATNTRVQIMGLEMHYLSKADLQWHELQNDVKVDGAAYVEDFAGDVNKPADKREESDGTISVTCGDGYNFHFWPTSGRINYPKDDVKGAYVTVRARLILDDPEGIDDRESARYVMGVGGDWWESLTAVWDNWTTNADMGIGRFRFVSSEWKSFNMISLPADTVRKYPPPFHTESPPNHIEKSKTTLNSLEVYPNPVNTSGAVKFSLSHPGFVNITVWGMEGVMIQNLTSEIFPAGEHTLLWIPSELPRGMYYLKLENHFHVELLKCLVL